MDCEWSVDEDGQKWDVCVECQAREDAVMAEIECVGREQALLNMRSGVFVPPPDGFDVYLRENG